jgi:hypothetical protein
MAQPSLKSSSRLKTEIANASPLMVPTRPRQGREHGLMGAKTTSRWEITGLVNDTALKKRWPQTRTTALKTQIVSLNQNL